MRWLWCPMSHFLCNIVFEVLAATMRQKMKLKGIQIGKVEVKESSFADVLKISLESSDAWCVLYQSSEKQNQHTETNSLSIDQWQMFWARYQRNDNLKKKKNHPHPTPWTKSNNLEYYTKCSKLYSEEIEKIAFKF